MHRLAGQFPSFVRPVWYAWMCWLPMTLYMLHSNSSCEVNPLILYNFLVSAMFVSLPLVSVLSIIFVFAANRFHGHSRYIWLINSWTPEGTGLYQLKCTVNCYKILAFHTDIMVDKYYIVVCYFSDYLICCVFVDNTTVYIVVIMTLLEKCFCSMLYFIRNRFIFVAVVSIL